MLRIGIDIGGTFTDFVIHDPEHDSLSTFKLLSDPANPALTVLKGLEKVSSSTTTHIIHGSTVATNALLERKGARTALITTRGFGDVLQIGRQNRPDLYDWFVKSTPVLVPADLRLEADERVDSRGKVLRPFKSSQIESYINILLQNRVESVAICLIFSFLYPDHENLIASQLRKAGFIVSVSSEILPEYREYERTSTTVVNAYVSPILDRYLSTLENSLPQSNLQVMQSNGGMIGLAEAKLNGARCILSGPAGGIVGAQFVAEYEQAGQIDNQNRSGIKLITFDMGGTSTDVSLIDEHPKLTSEAIVGGCPIHIPMLDIHTIGAGGGSIAYVDAGGSLHVGPQSAGADPGPACYGSGDLPTVTDANLVLGRILPDRFLGGQLQIYPERALKAFSGIGKQLNLSPIEAANGVIEVINVQMEKALRVISVERGYDPHDFTLFSFGGAGGLHAADLANSLGIPRVMVSKYASTLSALGMLASQVTKDYVQTVMLPGNTPYEHLSSLFSQHIKRGKQELMDEGIASQLIRINKSVDVRYVGQSYELSVPFSKTFATDFRSAHKLAYGYSDTNAPIEIVNLRLRAVGIVPPLKLPRSERGEEVIHPSPIELRLVRLHSVAATIPVYDYDLLQPGCRFAGPSLVVSADTTILIGEKDFVNVDEYQNLIVDIGDRKSINRQK